MYNSLYRAIDTAVEAEEVDGLAALCAVQQIQRYQKAGRVLNEYCIDPSCTYIDLVVDNEPVLIIL
jgi:hypothetical protein